MSRIITHLKCPKCGHEWRGYISFGHPNRDFTWHWRCESCGAINEELIKAMPMFDLSGYEKTRSFNWADEVHIKKRDSEKVKW